MAPRPVQALIGKLLHRSHRVPDLDDLELFFVFQHAQGDGVCIRHRHRRRGDVIQAPEQKETIGQGISIPGHLAAEADHLCLRRDPGQLLLNQDKVNGGRVRLPGEHDHLVSHRKGPEQQIDQLQAQLGDGQNPFHVVPSFSSDRAKLCSALAIAILSVSRRIVNRKAGPAPPFFTKIQTFGKPESFLNLFFLSLTVRRFCGTMSR